MSAWRRNLLFVLLLLMGLGSGYLRAEAESLKAVQFVFKDIDGRNIKLTDYRGKWVLISFWAPWCPLCKVQVPSLNSLNQRPDFRVIGIALEYGGSEDAIRSAVRSTRQQFEAQVAGGSRREPNSAFRQVGPVDFFPTSYLYDPTGEIVMFIPGQVRVPRVLAFMDKWHAERGGAQQPSFAAKPDKLATFLRQRYGQRGTQAYQAWKRMLDSNASAPLAQKVARVHEFFNQRIQPGEDEQNWGVDDYWTTPGELLGLGSGDSEDLALAKYFTLLALNIPPEQLRLVYVQPRNPARPATANPVHVVLAWYEARGREPQILDATGAIQLASQRPDLQPVYSFNSQGAWDEAAKVMAGGQSGRLAIWEDTLRRARAEGFE